MDSEHHELEETLGSDGVTLRMALAEAEMEISLLKIELMRTRQKLDRAEAALRAQSEPPASGAVSMSSEVVPRSRRTTVPPSLHPQEKIFTKSGFHSLATPGSLEAALRAAAVK